MLQTPAFVFACWLCVVAFIGLTRVYDIAPPHVIGLTVVSGTFLILALTKFNDKFRNSIEAIPTERLMCWHSIRAPIGAAFLIMASEGLLPDLFARRAGYGDMFTAMFGVLAIAICETLTRHRLKVLVYVAWNIIGLADLVLAVSTGVYLAFHLPDSMIWIARLPLLLVPTFVLPVLFATHFIMLGRLLLSTGKKPTMAE